MKENCILEVCNQDDKLEKIEVLKYFTLKQNNKDYIIYKPVKIGLNKDFLIFSAEIKESDDVIFLAPIEDKEIEVLIKKITDKLFKGDKI